jgi:hypothetical protein
VSQSEDKPAVIQLQLNQILLGFADFSQQYLLNAISVIHHVVPDSGGKVILHNPGPLSADGP